MDACIFPHFFLERAFNFVTVDTITFPIDQGSPSRVALMLTRPAVIFYYVWNRATHSVAYTTLQEFENTKPAY